MIRTFFEKEYDITGNLIDNTEYFAKMKIWQEKEICEKYQGKYPVITLSLKSAKQPTFELAYQMIVEQIASEFKRHRCLLKSDVLLEDEKERYQALMTRKGSQAEMATALKFLSDCLKVYHKQKVIVLIDEYDVPLENAYFRGFYEEMTDFIRSLFESVLKSNDSLEFAVITNQIAFPKPYWSNTSSNIIIKELIETADSSVRKEIEELIAGKEIKKPVHEDITYADVKESQDNLWNFLFFTGYLKMTGQLLEGNTVYLKLAIPNEEVRYIYQNTIQEWFKKSVRSKDLSSLEDYEILSNRESGNGRPDILLKPYDEKKPAVILELKYAEKFTQMEEKCKETLNQIDEKGYADGLTNEGYEKILKYGICFCQKSCRVFI